MADLINNAPVIAKVFKSLTLLLRTKVKNKIKSGLTWSTGSVLFKAILLVAQMILLARMLSSEELGQIVVLNVIIGLVYLLSDLGLTSAVIYDNKLPKATLAQLQAINIYFGLFLSILLAFLAESISNFYGVKELKSLILMIAPVFLMKSLGLQSYALSQRELNFSVIAKVDIVSTFFGFLTLLFSLFIGAGIYSIVVMQMTTAILFSFLSVYYSPSRFDIKFSITFREIEKTIKYAIYQSGDNIFNYLSSQADNVIIGKLLGMEVLGIYSYLKELLLKPSVQVINLIFNRMLFPIMSSYNMLSSKADVYLRSNRILALINTTMYLLLYLYGYQVVTMVYGESWLSEIGIYESLIPYVLLISLINPVGSLMKATGYVKRAFYWNVFTSIARVLIVICAASYGVVFLIKSLTFFMLSLFLLHYYYLLHPAAKISLKDMLYVYSPSFLFSILLCSLYLLSKHYYDHINIYITIPSIVVTVSYFIFKESKLIREK